jgi:hypothetical protein
VDGEIGGVPVDAGGINDTTFGLGVTDNGIPLVLTVRADVGDGDGAAVTAAVPVNVNPVVAPAPTPEESPSTAFALVLPSENIESADVNGTDEIAPSDGLNSEPFVIAAGFTTPPVTAGIGAGAGAGGIRGCRTYAYGK